MVVIGRPYRGRNNISLVEGFIDKTEVDSVRGVTAMISNSFWVFKNLFQVVKERKCLDSTKTVSSRAKPIFVIYNEIPCVEESRVWM